MSTNEETRSIAVTKWFGFLAVALSIAVPGIAETSADEATGNLTVVVGGMANNDGKLLIQLLDSKDAYDDKAEPFRAVKADIEGQKAEVVFESIPHGEYVVRMFHDANGSGELDKNFMGIPTERYGFSNNARGTLGPPRYDDAKFDFDAAERTLKITVK